MSLRAAERRSSPEQRDAAPEIVPASAASVRNRLFVLVLQHPHECKEPRATAAAAVGALRRAKMVVGLSWPNLARALGEDRRDPRRWGVLYLGSLRPAALAEDRPVLVVGRDSVPVADAAPILARLDGIVVLDGTWSEAKTLWWRNPWLLKLHRLVLNPPRPSRLGRLRREPRREALSTLEAIAVVLREVETEPAAADLLLAQLDRLIAPQAGRGSRLT
jgi:DTW domain-containing protein